MLSAGGAMERAADRRADALSRHPLCSAGGVGDKKGLWMEDVSFGDAHPSDRRDIRRLYTVWYRFAPCQYVFPHLH